MVYVLAWLYCFAMLSAVVRWRCRERLLCASAVLVMGAVAAFRGAVGTDTIAYEVISAAVRNRGVLAGGVEPAFAALLWVIQSFGLSDGGAVRAVALLDVLLLLVFVARSTDDERFFLLSAFLPAFFFSYTMNELRIGLASIVFLLACQVLSRAGKIDLKSGMLSLASVLMHYSAVLFPLYVFIAFVHRNRWSYILWGGCCFLSVLALIAIRPEYFMMKLNSYSGFRAPYAVSGLAGLTQVGIMLLAIWQSALSIGMKRRLLVLSAVLSLAFFGIVQLSYAGLRLLDLVVFICPLTMLCAHGVEGQRLNSRTRFWMVLFGLVSVGFVFRRFLVEPAGSLAPFLPYHSIFQ